jgi:hypothetical protein
MRAIRNLCISSGCGDDCQGDHGVAHFLPVPRQFSEGSSRKSQSCHRVTGKRELRAIGRVCRSAVKLRTGSQPSEVAAIRINLEHISQRPELLCHAFIARDRSNGPLFPLRFAVSLCYHPASLFCSGGSPTTRFVFQTFDRTLRKTFVMNRTYTRFFTF